AGKERISAINLIRGGQTIEILSCAAASSCTALSPPLALGDTFEADFPADAGATAGAASGLYSLTDGGTGIGYRQAAGGGFPAGPSLAACGTKEVGADPIVVGDVQPGEPQGALSMVIAPSQDTFEQNQADAVAGRSSPLYELFVDGRAAVYNSDGNVYPVELY